MHSLHQTLGMHLIHCITITSQANNETEKFEDNLCLVNDSKQRDNEAASCLSSGSFTPFWSSLPFLRWSQSNEAASCLSSRSFTPFCQSSPHSVPPQHLQRNLCIVFHPPNAFLLYILTLEFYIKRISICLNLPFSFT